MKKLIKIFLIILFIIFVFGITTSKAVYTVQKDVNDKEQVKKALLDGDFITGVSYEIRDDKEYFLCKQRYQYIYEKAMYKLVSKQAEVYPDDDSVNGHAKAYILAAPGYEKSDSNYNNGIPTETDERQYAWYCITGEVDGTNDLLTMARAYQDYKKQNNSFSVTTTNATVTFNGNDIVYGPIKINYTYKEKTSGSHTDKWGGFNYAFFDNQGNVINNKVELCTLKNNTYSPVTSTNGTNGYCNVRTEIKDDFYVVIKDASVSNVKVKIQKNDVNYRAEVYALEGDAELNGGVNYCVDCRSELANVSLTSYAGKSYKYQTTTSPNISISGPKNTSVYDVTQFTDFDGTTHIIQGSLSEVVATTTLGPNGETIYEYIAKKKVYCYKQFGCGPSRKLGKGNAYCGSVVNDGAVAESQQLYFIDTTVDEKVTNVDFEINIDLKGSIKVTKIWEDLTTTYRPNNIELKVSRSTDGKNWTELHNNTDYKLGNWTKNGNTWTLSITDLDLKDASGNMYYFKVEEKNTPAHYQVVYPNGNVIDKNATNKNITIRNEITDVALTIYKVWDDYDNHYNKRPENIEIEVYRSTNTNNWGNPLKEGTDYKISWTKQGSTWAANITDLKIKDDSGNYYNFKVVEKTELSYYEVTYSNNNGIISKDSTDKTLTITNKITKMDIEVEKVWLDNNNALGTRPSKIKLNVYRSIDKNNWGQPLVEGTDYNVVWKDTNTDNWKATITGLVISNGTKPYNFMIEEVQADGETTGSVHYYTPGYTSQDGKFIITNTLEYTELEITKQWNDANNNQDTRPNEIKINVYRSTDGNNWGQPLVEGKDYTISWTNKQTNNWKATVSNLLKQNANGDIYYFKVEEIIEDKRYEVKYSSGNNTDGTVSNNKVTITNELKYIDIELTKEWRNSEDSETDYNNDYKLRPNTIEFVVSRSTNNQNWEILTEGKHYEIQWISNGSTDSTWIAKITKLLGTNKEGIQYYFKVEEKENTDVMLYYDPVDGQSIRYNEEKWEAGKAEGITIKNKLKKINLSGYVWLDGQTGIKPAIPNNGKMDSQEQKLENIVVHLYYKQPKSQGGKVVEVAQTKTDKNGHYEFKDYEIGYYHVEFDYDGVHYEDTISGGDSNAFEKDSERTAFNNRFKTITYKKSNDGTVLDYSYADKKSTLNTTNSDGTIKTDFEMNALTQQNLIKTDATNLNLGLVKRGTDIALSTDLHDAKVSINGQETTYNYNRNANNIDIDTRQTSEQVTYNLNLYASDYNYRVRDYVTNNGFTENDYINDGNLAGVKSGDDLQVTVVYELNLQNQSTNKTKINEVKYVFDEKYTFNGIVGNGYTATNNGNSVLINLNGLELKEGETKTLYLEFLVNETNNEVSQGNFSNKAEITSYSTEEGLIDIDSQPGNFINDNQVEDDNDTAGGLGIRVVAEERKITGKVFDNNNGKSPINDVIVQLIELKTVNGKVYEYIWQETVSGKDKGLKLNGAGTALEQYSYTRADGYYEFEGFIPGDYIVRFIYGDGTSYDMTNNVIKYNGQDYKSIIDSKYNTEWYNTTSYAQGASVARDNEARRLETMAYGAEVDAPKGVLLKLLNNLTVDDLNETEKEILVSTYNSLYDPDITDVTADAITTLLKEEVLKNTWMCAETSKIKVAVDTENVSNIATQTEVNGLVTSYVTNIGNINLGLEQRPVTKIELKKYITGFKLTAANGQTLVNAYVDVNEYLNGTMDSNKVQGIKDNLIILDTVWQYEVIPTEINTVVDGAKLEFEYTLIVKNTGEEDYLSTELANKYANSSIADYKEFLENKASAIKSSMRNGTYRTQIGNSIGHRYYAGGTGGQKVLTEVTNIRDYVNNELTFVTSGKVEIDGSAPQGHRILRDDYSMQEATINTILKTTESTGPMQNNGSVAMYTVALEKNPISSTGNLEFDTYIAEVMRYTNAAGRRTITSTPGNAEIIEAYPSPLVGEHEIDEADTGRVQIGSATGEDMNKNYIMIISIALGVTTLAIGAFVVKKYVIK